MNASEILELVRAGYTKAEIAEMDNSMQSPPDPAGHEDPAPDHEDPAPDHEDPAPADEQLNKRLDGIEARINHLINKSNYDAVKNSRQPDKPVETTDEILAAYVRGQKKEE